MIWVAAVELDGVDEVRKLPGYHDELLQGMRTGQRSIRLSRSYRAIYQVKKDVVEFVSVEEVSKHDYYLLGETPCVRLRRERVRQ